MNRPEAIDAYAALTEAQQVSLLIKLACELTVAARSTYAAGSEDVSDPQRLRTFNELQHRVTHHLRHLIEHDTDRYPDSTFAEMVYEATSELDLTSKFHDLLANAHGQTGPKKKGAVKPAGRVA